MFDLERLPGETVWGLMCWNCFQIFTDTIPGVRMGENRLIRDAQPEQHKWYPHSTLPDPDDPELEEESPLGAGGERRRSAQHRGNDEQAGAQPAAQPAPHTPRKRSAPASFTPSPSCRRHEPSGKPTGSAGQRSRGRSAATPPPPPPRTN
jgi:hypothetical protein